MPALYGRDTHGCVIYVGSFSKTMFPALRLGFLIVPDTLVDAFASVRRGDRQPPTLDQVVLTDFITAGHYARHTRRMRHVYAERYDAIQRAVARACPDLLQLYPGDTGLHVAAHLVGARSDTRIADAFIRRGIEVAPLSAYCLDPPPPKPRPGLVLGFAAIDPSRIAAGMRTLADVIKAAS